MVTPDLKEFKNQRVKRGTRIVNPIPKRLYTLKEAALYLGRGLHGVRNMVWKGEVPVVRNGRKMFLDIRDLDIFIERNKTTYV
jgi:excisionase family DNA binding protein